MPASLIPGAESAIRAGLNTVLFQSNQQNSVDFASDALAMVSKTQERVENFVKSSSSGASVTQLVEDNMDLIKLALKAVILAYQGLSAHMNETAAHRKQFEEELQLSMATFTIPGNLESMKLSKEHQAVDGFLKKINAYPRLFAYSGVKNIIDNEDSRTRHFCALPLFTINQLEHPSASPRDLDQARVAINLLFNSKAVQTMQKMADDFRTDNSALILCESIYERQNYLNDLRAPRLILTMLLNILWNLQHPVDCKTGFGLSLSESVKLCSQFNEFLNIYLADKTAEGPYKINSKVCEIQRIISHIELKSNKLFWGFVDEKLRQFNLKSLTNNAHLTLRELDTSLFQVIFKKRDVVSGIEYPDKSAALDIADTISVLNDLLDKNSAFFELFDDQRKKIPSKFFTQTYINPESITVIDALIIFCHLTAKQREQFIDQIRRQPDASEDSNLLAKELSIFNKNYIIPLETIHLVSLSTKEIDLSTKSKLLAIIIIPLFTLTASDFRIKVDTRKSLSRIKDTTDENGRSQLYSGVDQLQMINNTAQEHANTPPNLIRGEYAYYWSLSPFLKLTPEAAGSVDSLPSKQYRMTQITELLDYISELTLNYKSFLQYKSFQTFLLDCLQQVDAEYRQFAEEATLVEQVLSLDGKLDRTLKSVLMTMTNHLSNNLAAFRQTIDEISHIISAPDFTELRKQELDKQIKRIEIKFMQLFGRAPINFTNTYQQILCRSNTTPRQIEPEEKAKQLYEFSLLFFTETKEVLLKYKPSLPLTPHFLSKLKKDKIDKYIQLIDFSVDYINSLKSNGNFSLDSYGLINQLRLIGVDKAITRNEADIKKSTYCQVIIEELNIRIKQQALKERKKSFVQPMDASLIAIRDPSVRTTSTLFTPAPPVRSNAMLNAISITSSISPMQRSRPSSGSIHSIEHGDDQLVRTYAILHEELKATLQRYIASKENEVPTHWFFQILHTFKNWFGLFSDYINVRLLDTKLQVAKKVLHALNTPTNTTHTKLQLNTNEIDTLSNGTLGNKTFYFRKHAFWTEFAHVEEENIHPRRHLLSIF